MPEPVDAQESAVEDQKSLAERHFGEDIKESFESIVKSLEDLGLIRESKVEEPPFVVYSLTDRVSDFDLTDLPSPVDVSRILGHGVDLPKPEEVLIDFGSPEPANNYLHIVWRGPNYQEELRMHSNRPKVGPELDWVLNTEDSSGEKVKEERYFDGKLGGGYDEFPDSSFVPDVGRIEGVPVNLRRLSGALEKKAEQILGPNQVSRYFGG